MKFFGTIGFWLGDIEKAPGVFRPEIVERSYTGDIITNRRDWDVRGDQNDGLTIKNRISILSDMFMQQNWRSIRYVDWNGPRLKVTSVTVDYPRITLELGGDYNAETENRTT